MAIATEHRVTASTDRRSRCGRARSASTATRRARWRWRGRCGPGSRWRRSASTRSRGERGARPADGPAGGAGRRLDADPAAWASACGRSGCRAWSTSCLPPRRCWSCARRARRLARCATARRGRAVPVDAGRRARGDRCALRRPRPRRRRRGHRPRVAEVIAVTRAPSTRWRSAASHRASATCAGSTRGCSSRAATRRGPRWPPGRWRSLPSTPPCTRARRRAGGTCSARPRP